MDATCSECGSEIDRRAGRVWGLCDDCLAPQVKEELADQGRPVGAESLST